jgi:serine protease inhibitor
MIKKLLLSLFVAFLFTVKAQKTCGFDQIHRELLQNNPQYAKDLDAFEVKYQDFSKSYRKRGGVYKIPVVVHVMETGGAITAITDQQIKDAIKALNEKYRKIPGTNGDGNGVDITIEFALAVRDPNNNCTSGINRIDMSKDALYMSDGVKRSTSGISDASLKSYISWNQTKYYNIWLVSEIDNNNGGAGVQGYAYFSSSHGTSADGAVILVNSFKDTRSNTLSHELGHAFNLYHTFEGDQDSNGNAQCPSNANCSSDGDKVCDTPPHKRSSSDCVVGTNACDNNSSTTNFIHNYMDYSSDVCANEFTAGQKVRMLAALTTDRSSFLESNGNMSLVPVVSDQLDFVSSVDFICSGGNVTFYDQSACIPNTYIDGDPWSNISYLWTIVSGNNSQTSTKQTPTFTLSNSGVYDVTLAVTTLQGTYNLTKKGIVVVGSSPLAACTPTSSNNGNYWYTVNNVTFNTIYNTTDSYINYGYTDFTCSKSTIVKPGNQYTFSASLRAAPNYPENVEAYIDYNNNGTFENSELIYSGSVAANSTGTVSGLVTIPNNATTDQPLRMRVYGEANTLTSAEKSCSASMFVGDVEDYTVYISSKAASVSISASPSSTINYGTSTTFTATPTNGGANPIYNWYLNDQLISGQNNATYTSSTLLDGDQLYCVLISNLSGVTNSPAKSNVITMTVTGAPLSNFSASSTFACTSSTISFTDESKLNPTTWNWTFQGGTPATSTSQNPSVVFGTPGTYTVTLVASNSNGTGTTATKTSYITTYAAPSAICNSTRSKSPAGGIGITSFTFNDLAKTSAYDDAAYLDYSCSNITFLSTSSNYQVTVGTNGTNSQWLRVYIDYNGDGDFADAGETVFSPANAKTSFTGTITTPANPTKDKILRMRVITDFLNTAPGSCTALEYGQAEDYGIVFKSVSCTNPATPTVSVVQPSCQTPTASVSIKSSTSGLTFSTDGVNYNTYTTPFSFNPGTTYSITAKNVGGCVSSPVTGSISQLPSNTTPTFNSVSPICSGNSLAALPTTSINNITGTWSPALDNTKTTTYTFTPTQGQCANTTTLSITVNPIVTPSFTSVNAICSGATLSALPSTSTNSITGTWSPALDNTKTTTYTFTPTQGQCANTTTLSITVNPIVTPSFTSVNAICSGATLSALPTTSTNSISGTWSPALDNTKTTTYTFTPAQGQCANTTTLSITVNSKATPTFNSVNSICSGGNLAALPTTSTNSITGTWSPALDNTKTTTYTFTPAQGQCANTTTLSITVTPNVTPTFNSVSPICSGGNLVALPTTSTNNITGSWSPALDNTKTTTYTFTPSNGQCANTTSLTISVNSTPLTPTFNINNSICIGQSINALPTSSNENVIGSWSPALDNTKTTTYTFTPDQNQCAISTTQTITVNAKLDPTFNPINAICEGTNLNQLNTTSLNNITGTWSPVLDNTKTTTYTFTPDQNQCANTTTLTVVVNKIPNAGSILNLTDLCIGKSLNVGTTVVGGVWNSSNNSIATIDQNGVVNAISAGQVSFTYAVTENNCSSTVVKSIQVNNCASISNVSDELVEIYPNPVINELNISQENYQFSQYRIFDAIGRIVLEGNISVKEAKVNVQKLVVGQYTLRLETAEGEYKHINFNKN